MAVTAVQTRSGFAAASTVTVNITTTAGNLLGAGSGTSGGTGPGLPTRTGDTFTNAVASFSDGSGGPENIRGDLAQNIGGNANAVTGNGVAGGTLCCVTEFAGAKTSGALGVVNHGTATTSTVQTGSVTPTAASALMTVVTGDGSGSGAATINLSFVVDETGGAGTVWDQADSVGGGSAHLDNVSAVATNPTWTSGWSATGFMGALIMEFLAAATAGLIETHMDCGQQSEMGSAI